MGDDLSRAFKALGHPHRLTIMRRLIDAALVCEAASEEECTLDSACCDFAALADELDVGKSTVSHHLKELHEAGLIDRIRDGRRLYCRADTERLDALRHFLGPRAVARERQSRCAP